MALGRKGSREAAGRPRAIIYCRVSTKEQTKNLSLGTQERECRRFCEREGYEAVKVFREMGESAKTLNRTSLRDLLAYCREHGKTIDYVVVYSVDRFSRDRADYFLLGKELEKVGVIVKSATQPIGDDSSGRLMEGILASFAQFDNDVRSERTAAGMRAALAEGRWTFRAPISYLHVADAQGRNTIEPDPQTAPHIRHAFELMATGNFTKTDALRRINARGLRTAKGQPLTAQTFMKVLTNPMYAGWMSVPSWGLERIRGSFEPMVEEATFARVQRVLDGRGGPLIELGQGPRRFPLTSLREMRSL